MDIEITETRSDHRSINIPKETCFQIDGILYATQNSFDQEEIFIVTITKRNYHRPPFQLAGRFSTKRKNTPRSSPPPLKIHVASRLICFFFSTPLKRARTYTSAVTCNTGRSIFRTFSFNGSRPFRCFLPAAVCKESYTHTHTQKRRRRRRICIPEAWHRLSRGFSKERKKERSGRDRAQNRGDEVLYKY